VLFRSGVLTAVDPEDHSATFGADMTIAYDALVVAIVMSAPIVAL